MILMINQQAHKISVLIPTYNRAEMIRDAIDSILAQTYSNLEIIVYDDGSTDGTSEVLETYGDKIIVIRSPTNKGCAYARNVLLDAATGEYACWQDSDDWSNIHRLERQLGMMRSGGTQMNMCGTLAVTNPMSDSNWAGLPIGCGCHCHFTPGTTMFLLKNAVRVPLLRSLGGSDKLWVQLMSRDHGLSALREFAYFARLHSERITAWKHRPELAWHQRMLKYKI